MTTHKPQLQVRLFVMTDSERGPHPLELIQRLPRGSVLIFRHYEEINRANLAQKVVCLCRRLKILCLIAGDLKLALRIRADGVHFPEGTLKRLGKRPNVRKNMIITAAAHSSAMVKRSENIDLDAIILSPVYITKSHPTRTPLGHLRFARICKKSKIPLIALGGIKRENIPILLYAGAFGIAGIGLFGNLKKRPGPRYFRGIGI